MVAIEVCYAVDVVLLHRLCSPLLSRILPGLILLRAPLRPYQTGHLGPLRGVARHQHLTEDVEFRIFDTFFLEQFVESPEVPLLALPPPIRIVVLACQNQNLRIYEGLVLLFRSLGSGQRCG